MGSPLASPMPIAAFAARIEYCGVIHNVAGTVCLVSPGVFRASWRSPRNVGHCDSTCAEDARQSVLRELRASYGQFGEQLTDALWNQGADAVPAVPTETGVKQDDGKVRWALLPFKVLVPVVRVLEWGARKYAPGNWMLVPNGEERYFEALMRHVEAYQSGGRVDPESGLPELAHVMANAIFLLGLEMGMGKVPK